MADDLFSDEFEYDLTDDEKKTQFEYVEKRILSGINDNNAFDLLEAESTLMKVGHFEPSDEVADAVVGRVGESDYYNNMDMLRLTGYLQHRKIIKTLERHFVDLKVIWQEQDEIRMAESYKSMLTQVARRAEEISALKVAADPYMKTLDTFFEKSFSQRNLSRFPQLEEVRNNLYDLRKEGGLSKDNVLSVLAVAKERIEKLVQEKMGKLEERYQGKQPKPNKVIAIYYCLLEALLAQNSKMIVVDEEFLDKIGQDFRAAIGHGTKRYVLNTLLKFQHDAFSEIAAEARFSLRPSTIEKVERKEEGHVGFKHQKVDLQEMQIYELYKTAAEVIAQNPTGEVFHDLLHSYSIPSLLLGLRAILKADIGPYIKLNFLKTLLDLGTVNEYVFIRAMSVLAQLDIPAARGVLTKVIAERYGWRKVAIPQKAFDLIIEGISKAKSSGDIFEIAKELVPPDRINDIQEGKGLGYPYQEIVYNRIFDKLATRFEKNPFHGVNEVAQYALFKSLLLFIQHTNISFAASAKGRALAMIRKMFEVSRSRTVEMVEELTLVFDAIKNKRTDYTDKEKAVYRVLITDIKRTLSTLIQLRGTPTGEERLLRDLPQKVLDHINPRTRSDQTIKVLQNSFRQLLSAGLIKMETRNKNILLSAKKSGNLDETMLAEEYPASSRAKIRAGNALQKYIEYSDNELGRQLLPAIGMENLPGYLDPPGEAPTEKETQDIWKELEPLLQNTLEVREARDKCITVQKLVVGAARHNLTDIIISLFDHLYCAVQPADLRLAFLSALPLEAHFAELWKEAMNREEVAVLLAIKNNFGLANLKRIKVFVPELLDLLE